MYTVAAIGHVLAVVILVGSTAMMAFVILPAADRGRLSPPAVRSIGRGFSVLTAISGVLIPLTGLYVSSAQYSLSALVSTTSGYIVVASILIWVALALVLIVATSRLARSVAVDEVQRAASESKPWYNGAVVLAVLGVAISVPL